MVGNPHLVANLYRPGKRPANIAAKLTRMIGHPPGGKVPDNVAWPLARILTETDETQGYIMRKAPPGALPAAIFTSRKLRRQRADMRTRSHKETQRIMARIVAQYADTMQTLHDAGYAIGDVNDKNLLAWADGRIMVLGADSFQVPADNGHNFRCPVGRAEYQAPEVIEKMSRPCRSGTCPGSPVRTQRATDTLTGHQSTTRFAMAIIAYQAICHGRHPYSGRLSPTAQPAPKCVDRIRLGYITPGDYGREPAPIVSVSVGSAGMRRTDLWLRKMDALGCAGIIQNLVAYDCKTTRLDRRVQPSGQSARCNAGARFG